MWFSRRVWGRAGVLDCLSNRGAVVVGVDITSIIMHHSFDRQGGESGMTPARLGRYTLVSLGRKELARLIGKEREVAGGP